MCKVISLREKLEMWPKEFDYVSPAGDVKMKVSSNGRLSISVTNERRSERILSIIDFTEVVQMLSNVSKSIEKMTEDVYESANSQ